MTEDMLSEPGKPFRAPEVRVGTIVLFRETPEETVTTPAIVLRVYENGLIDCHAFVRGLQIPFEALGCRHISDPIRPVRDRSVWEHTPEHKELAELKKALASKK
jgi:hypothetical protein